MPRCAPTTYRAVPAACASRSNNVARNIEIKARIENVASITPRVAQLATEGPLEIAQDDTFFRCDNHVSIEELLARVRTKDRRVGYATVYRTLKLLAECGVANERQDTEAPGRVRRRQRAPVRRRVDALRARRRRSDAPRRVQMSSKLVSARLTRARLTTSA